MSKLKSTMHTQPSKSNFTGCLLGGAIGDALGAPVEFDSIVSIRQQYGAAGITDYVEYEGNQGEFTDDTQITLFTAEGLLRAYHRAVLKGIGGAEYVITHHSYLRWLHTQGYSVDPDSVEEGIYDVEKGWLVNRKELYRNRAPGNTCISALMSGTPGKIERPINNSKGCGGVMRIAPVGLIFIDSPRRAFEAGSKIAAITHGHPSGYLSAGVFAAIISQLAAGADLKDAINNSIKILIEWEGHEEILTSLELALSIYKDIVSSGKINLHTLPETIERIGGGWVGEEALAIAVLCCLLCENDFTKGMLASVNHSGDSDSTGSITGNILGLINGVQAIPQNWIENLRFYEIVKEVGEDLFTGCKSSTFNCNDEWWNKYPGY